MFLKFLFEIVNHLDISKIWCYTRCRQYKMNGGHLNGLDLLYYDSYFDFYGSV